MLYPVLVCVSHEQNKPTYNFSLPDMAGCIANENSIDSGIQTLTKVIEKHLEILVEYGEAIPSASQIENHLTSQPENFLTWLLIEIDILPYLGKSHKINVTLPELLIAKIDKKVEVSAAYKTRSHFIAEACLSELKN